MFAVSWWLFWLLLVPIGDRYLPLLLGQSLGFLATNPFCIVIILTIAAIVCATLAYQLMRNSISVVLCRTLIVLYLIAAPLAIMLKSRGVQGINLNIMDIISQFMDSPAVLLFNVLIFIPAGMIFHGRYSHPARPYIVIVVVILLMESCQYLFHLGVFDIVDILTNLAGFTIGYLIAGSFHHAGHRFVRNGVYYENTTTTKTAQQRTMME